MADKLLKDVSELFKALDKLPGKIQLKIVDSALRKSALVVAESVRQEVPKRSGRLQNNVIVKKRTTKGTNYTTFKIGFAKGIAGHAVYAHFGSINNAPNHFMFRAMDNTKGEVNKIMRDELRKKIDAQIRKLNKGKK